MAAWKNTRGASAAQIMLDRHASGELGALHRVKYRRIIKSLTPSKFQYQLLFTRVMSCRSIIVSLDQIYMTCASTVLPSQPIIMRDIFPSNLNANYSPDVLGLNIFPSWYYLASACSHTTTHSPRLLLP